MKKSRQDTGEAINRRYQLGCRQVRFRATGDFFMELERFPGAYVDGDYGAIIFRTKEEHDRLYDVGFFRVYEVEKDGKRRVGGNHIRFWPAYVKLKKPGSG